MYPYRLIKFNVNRMRTYFSAMVSGYYKKVLERFSKEKLNKITISTGINTDQEKKEQRPGHVLEDFSMQVQLEEVSESG